VDNKGNIFDAKLESITVHDSDGNLVCRTAMSNITERKQAEEVSQEARIYSESIIDTVREPFVVLDKDLKVLSANRSFYSTFKVTPDETVGNLIYDIGDRQWDIPSLRTLLEEILPKNTQFINYEVSHEFQTIGQKIMLLNARQIYQEVIGTPIILLAIEDITERKQAEKVSQEARIYAENIIETVREPFVVLDKDLKVRSANHSFYSTFEVTPDETVGKLIYDIGNRQWDIPSLRTLLEEILPKNTQFINYEVSHEFQTIGQKIMLLNARQIYQEVIGTPIILLAIEDITERKRAEKVSQEARIYAESIIDTVREPFVILDTDLKVLSANRSFYSTFKVTPDETVGNLIYDIGDRQWDIPSLRKLLEEILPKNTQFNNYEVSHEFQTIGQKIMLLNARQIYQEVIGTPIILLAIEDITQRKQAEEVSQEARIYAENIIDTVREPFVVLDKDLKVRSANRSFYSTFKVTPDETVGNLIYDIGDRQWDIPKLRELLEKIIPMNTQFQDFEIAQEFHNIGLRAMLLNACRIKLESSNMMLLAIEDITEHKKLEVLHLENERLISASKARSEFLTIMSHELRTPLTSVIGYSIILEGKTQGELNEKQRIFVDNILKSSKHLLDLINNFLELAKTEAGKQELVLEEISVSYAINEIFEIIKENAIEHDIILRKEFDPEIQSIKADRMALKQILFNLLNNAIKFSKKEGGIVTVSTKRENDMVKISVADTGIGIKEKDLPRLFQKFEQLDSGISRKYDGTGLGLAITKQLVDLHGGKIWVESKYGQGSNFIFLLPVGGKK
jgi:PAS domain S-box-containing protein